MSFFLAIPALTAAGILQAVTESDEISDGVGWGPTLVAARGLASSVAYASIAWLLRYVAGHNFDALHRLPDRARAGRLRADRGRRHRAT